jgi:hypothetical protein
MTAYKLKCFNIFKKKKFNATGITITYILNKNKFMGAGGGYTFVWRYRYDKVLII